MVIKLVLQLLVGLI